MRPTCRRARTSRRSRRLRWLGASFSAVFYRFQLGWWGMPRCSVGSAELFRPPHARLLLMVLFICWLASMREDGPGKAPSPPVEDDVDVSGGDADL